MATTGIPLSVNGRSSEADRQEQVAYLDSHAPTGSGHQALFLSVHRSRFRMDDEGAEPADETFREVRPKILERQKHQCYFCGHKQHGWMQVHHMNCVHDDNSPENLKVVDFMCHAVNHLWLAGKPRGKRGRGGQIIYLPGVSQTLLNRFVMGLFVVATSGSADQVKQAGTWYSQLQRLSTPVVDIYGTDDAQKFGQMLQELPESLYDQRENLMPGLRFLMSSESYMYQPAAVEAMAQQWRQLFPRDAWEGIRAQVFDSAGEVRA
ncbi:hypothetical protein E2P84_36735 [Burkholderia cepacia]|uniref:HNH endonuclease n=1 Tax=Burkholderia cepacia TaxID=292 RepID=A0AAX2RQL4_BURCE|nr:hypothetical protein [Burkholderia cepacia]TES65678.1 hypothetical protein E2P84_36735 [Burkholderia cepacia]TET01666.1 hypothetical protein E3D36_16660 [Burkholderia cepacia]TEU47524.1 hypothetical protein E3D37_16090 [Burkholderia cepacia]TEU53551.1 hypothetical protein E3D38_12480 [Burkholderia cepacia]TEV02157.1 hypothetical protein E3D40_13410 [Burkholderia cepacia]